MRIAVIGGTGMAGQHTVQAMERAGHQTLVISRSRGVDVTTGQGLDEALAGVDVVVDVTSFARTIHHLVQLSTMRSSTCGTGLRCRGAEMTATTGVHLFEQCRALLMGLAYRMLGSRVDAEDAVQDTFVKWQNANQTGIDNPAGWLTTICTRRCIDLLRSAHRTRVEYVGTWLPEPIQMASVDLAETKDDLAPSLATAFLLMLERLTPKERAAYLLHEIFDVSYGDVARVLGIQESACRKLVSRARQNIEHAKVRHVTPVERQEQLLAAFEAAVTSGHVGPLATMLSDEIELCADGGGKVEALLDVLRGRIAVEGFITENLHEYWEDHDWVPSDINGHRGFIVRRGGTITAAIPFGYDETGHTANIYIIRNPDKLSRLAAPTPAHP